MFVNNSFTVSQRDDLISNVAFNSSAEILFLEITKPNFKCLLGSFYRHLSFIISQFTSNLELVFQSLLFRKFQSCCILSGDFNADLLKYDSNNEISRFFDLLISFNFIPLSTLPTHITNSSATIIDHVYYRPNSLTKDCNIDVALSGCLTADISDHLANFLVLPLIVSKRPSSERPLIRIFSNSNKIKFINSLNNTDWGARVYNHNDVNLAYEIFLTAIKSNYEECFSLT